MVTPRTTTTKDDRHFESENLEYRPKFRFPLLIA